jgi:type VI protein secretion system component VasK
VMVVGASTTPARHPWAASAMPHAPRARAVSAGSATRSRRSRVRATRSAFRTSIVGQASASPRRSVEREPTARSPTAIAFKAIAACDCSAGWIATARSDSSAARAVNARREEDRRRSARQSSMASIRRFCARPSSVSFDATGCVSP